MYEKIKRWYQQGLWTDLMIRNAVKKGVLTENEGSAIINDRDTSN